MTYRFLFAILGLFSSVALATASDTHYAFSGGNCAYYVFDASRIEACNSGLDTKYVKDFCDELFLGNWSTGPNAETINTILAENEPFFPNIASQLLGFSIDLAQEGTIYNIVSSNSAISELIPFIVIQGYNGNKTFPIQTNVFSIDAQRDLDLTFFVRNELYDLSLDKTNMNSTDTSVKIYSYNESYVLPLDLGVVSSMIGMNSELLTSENTDELEYPLIAILDSDFDESAEELQIEYESMFVEKDLVNTICGGVAIERKYDGSDLDEDKPTYLHGTVVAYIIAHESSIFNTSTQTYTSPPLLPIKITSDTSSCLVPHLLSAGICKAIQWKKTHNFRNMIINISGSDPNENYLIHKAVQLAAKDNRCLVFASSGNICKDESRYLLRYPASYDDDLVLSVSGLVNNGDKYTRWQNANCCYHVDFAAPVLPSITSTEKSQDGVSFAVPLISAAAAVVWAKHPDWDRHKVVQCLWETGVSVPGFDHDVRRVCLDEALKWGESH
ncbi:S8/S53 family peptidase [bacterium]|nr:S8/S53 family peptidase [bacterium]